MEPSSRGDPYQLLELELPRPLKTCSEDFENDKTRLHINPFMFTEDVENPWKIDSFFNWGGRISSDHLKIFANCDYNHHLFRTDIIPYQYLSIIDYSGDTFWSWIKPLFEEQIQS